MPSRSEQFEKLNEPQRRGDATEAIVVAEFSIRGYTVLFPHSDNEPYDFVIVVDGEFNRFQAKTAYESKNKEVVRFETRSTRVKNKRYEREGYVDEIEYFAVYSPISDEIYVVPIEKAPANQMAIRHGRAARRI